MDSDDPVLRSSWRARLDVFATITMTVASLAIVWAIIDRPTQPSSGRPLGGDPPLTKEPKIPSEPVELGTNRLGGPTAQVGLVIYSDFQCPFCSRFARETLPIIIQEYVEPGRVMLAFKHLPLERIHPMALTAAETATCAGEQGKFWPMHDLLFSDPKGLNDSALAGYAKKLGLESALAECIKSGRKQPDIEADAKEALQMGFTGTPAFLIGKLENGRVRASLTARGAKPILEFRTLLDRALLEGGEPRK